jgi:pterin-4a-carbinolamine dehydratase
MKLKLLHEEFIEKSKRPMQFGRMPINPKSIELPVVPMSKWEALHDPIRLSKVFIFKRVSDRNSFINELMNYESEVKHHANLTITEDKVQVQVFTKDLEKITELDKEYSKFADEIYKEISLIGKNESRRSKNNDERFSY